MLGYKYRYKYPQFLFDPRQMIIHPAMIKRSGDELGGVVIHSTTASDHIAKLIDIQKTNILHEGGISRVTFSLRFFLYVQQRHRLKYFQTVMQTNAKCGHFSSLLHITGLCATKPSHGTP